MTKQGVPLRRLCYRVNQLVLKNWSQRSGDQKYPRFSHRLIHNEAASQAASAVSPAVGLQKPPSSSRLTRNIEEYKQAFDFGQPSPESELEKVGAKVVLNGFLSKRRVMHSKLLFADLDINSGRIVPKSIVQRVPERQVQLTSAFQQTGSPEEQVNKDIRAIPLHSPVSVTATVAKVTEDRVDLTLESIKPLNTFPKNIIVSEGAVFPPTARHLQIRFSQALRTRMFMRNVAAKAIQEDLWSQRFLQVETPLLFKSTPEGASEFLVPTRRKGMAYALPQSPQQYKQLLMASNVKGYYQFARCFRDEDLRADRQPEFTQLDLEMAFATAKDVRDVVERLVKNAVFSLSQGIRFTVEDGKDIPIMSSILAAEPRDSHLVRNARSWRSANHTNLFTDEPFPCISYAEAMAQYGSDKPDLRIPFKIHRVDHILPPDFIQKITPLQNPIVEVIVFQQKDKYVEYEPSMGDVKEFMDSLPSSLLENSDGGPAPLHCDPLKPIRGLSALGFEAPAEIEQLEGMREFSKGDILIFQARENKPFEGGSTALGRIRTALYDFVVQKGILRPDRSWRFLWVNQFPMFTPNNDKDPGQGGASGFSATHHPFTAPFSQADFDLLSTDPLAARGDSFDLVVNGIELGGGSRRIHLAEMQEDIMREVLKMSDERVALFSHLIGALRAGCPPHAGFALGFDRLVAVLSYADSLRDVIAFPKSKKGEDMMVKSPARMSDADLERYHLALRRKEDSVVTE